MQVFPALEETESSEKGWEKVIMYHKILCLVYLWLLRSCRKMAIGFSVCISLLNFSL